MAALTQWCGIPAADAAAVAFRLDAGARGRLVVSTSADLSAPIIGPEATVDAQLMLRVTATGLAPDTAYFFGAQVDGAVLATGRGQFRTAPAGSASFSFAHGSCIHPLFGATPTAARITASGARFFAQLGDLFYPDETQADLSVASFRRSYDTGPAATRFDTVLSAMPVAHVFDDHDAGGSDISGADPDLPNAQQVLREREAVTLPDARGVYRTWTWGRCRFIVLDCRSFRSSNGAADDGSKTMLGAGQKTWLHSTLAAAREPLIIVIGTVVWNDPRVAGGDAWGGFTTERDELIADWTSLGAIDRMLIVNGDAHMLGADDGTNSPGGIPCVVAGPLGHGSGSRKGGTFSQGTLPGTSQYGLVRVTDVGSALRVDWTGFNDAGAAALSLSFEVPAAVGGLQELTDNGWASRSLEVLGESGWQPAGLSVA